MLLPAVGAIVAVLGTGCLVSLQQEHATNVVGTSHTVTAEFNDDLLDELCQALDEISEGDADCDEAPVELQEFPWVIFFDVISGPNEGAHSTDDCDPSCEGFGAGSVSWTYTSDGTPGKDTIRACLVPDFLAQNAEEFLEFFADIEDSDEAKEFLAALEDITGQELNSFEDVFCPRVTKTWVEPEVRRNVGGAIDQAGAALAARANRERAAEGATGAATIRPPSTGGGGLAAR